MLLRAGERIQVLRDTLTELVTMEEPRKSLAALLSGLDARYDLGEGHPLLGRRMPDLAWPPQKARCGSTPCCTRRGRR